MPGCYGGWGEGALEGCLGFSSGNGQRGKGEGVSTFSPCCGHTLGLFLSLFSYLKHPPHFAHDQKDSQEV